MGHGFIIRGTIKLCGGGGKMEEHWLLFGEMRVAEGQDQAGDSELRGCNEACICENKKVLLKLKK